MVSASRKRTSVLPALLAIPVDLLPAIAFAARPANNISGLRRIIDNLPGHVLRLRYILGLRHISRLHILRLHVLWLHVLRLNILLRVIARLRIPVTIGALIGLRLTLALFAPLFTALLVGNQDTSSDRKSLVSNIKCNG